MIEELKEEELTNKVGGRFRLSALIQQRLVALNNGSEPFVNVEKGASKLEIVIKEIMEGKIRLCMEGESDEADEVEVC